MHLSTPPQPRFRPSSGSGSGTPYTPTNARARHFASRPSQLAAAASSSSSSETSTPTTLARDKGTPVGRLLAREAGQATPRSPRRVRQRTWVQKAQDWPANFVMSLETSIQLWSFDSAGYPLAIGLNAVHLLTRLPVFAAALPTWARFGSARSGAGTRSRYYAAAQELADADARLAALRRETSGATVTWGWIATGLSILLILISLANAAYLFSRRRTYQLVLRKDPLASPNARSSTLDFSRPGDTPSLFSRLKRTFVNRFKTPSDQSPQQFQIQELNVWTPDYVLLSLRLFTLYPPPVSLMYHFVTPSSFLPLVLIGSATAATTFTLVRMYTTLLADRAMLQAEVMHEYNAKFVNPRVFVAKRDAATSTSELEFAEWRGVTTSAGRRGTSMGTGAGYDSASVYSAAETELSADALDQVVRGSGRKARRRTDVHR